MVLIKYLFQVYSFQANRYVSMVTDYKQTLGSFSLPSTTSWQVHKLLGRLDLTCQKFAILSNGGLVLRIWNTAPTLLGAERGHTTLPCM